MSTGAIRTAEVIAVGSELLTPWRQDTNSLFITEQLNTLGIEVCVKTIVGDDRRRIASALRAALDRVPLVVLTGGLGPTADDLTRDVVAEVLNRPLAEDPAIRERIRRRFESRGWIMPEVNRRQALVPRGAEPLDNPRGTAPGLWIADGHAVVVLLPGPPAELQPMLRSLVADRLAARATGERLYRRVLHVTGRPESDVEQSVLPIYSRWSAEALPIETTILAAPGQIELHLATRASSPEAGEARLAAAVEELAQTLGASVYSIDGRSLEQVVGDLLRSTGQRIAVAESCSGGLLLSRLTDVPGASDYVASGIVAYSNQAKIDLLGVPAALIASHGAVSEPVAAAMASGVRQRVGADIGIGLTGIAGPGGATAEKPVGMVCLAMDGPGAAAHAATFRFPGDRLQVKRQSVRAALDLVRRTLCART